MIKSASAQELPLVEKIMQEIYDEDPSYWPYGVGTEHFNGGLYLVQKQANADPVGFVGWQKFDEGDRKVGYYAVGILPEHRQQSFAKQAVAQVIREIGNECDEAKAFIMAHNEPSKALARSLNVSVIEKAANAKKTLLGALGTTAMFDQAADPSRSLTSTLQPHTWDKERLLMGGLNALLGGLGGNMMSKGEFGKGLTAIALAPTKDLAMKGVGTLHNVDDAAKAFADTAGEAAAPSNTTVSVNTTGAESGGLGSIPKGAWIGAGALGATGLGLLAYNLKQKADHRKEELEAENKGRVRITLPTKQKGDAETEVDLPFDELNLSKALRGRLGRDTRRRLHEETKARTKHRKPRDPKNLTDKEKEDAALEKERKELDKSATLSNLAEELDMLKSAIGPAPAPQAAVPSPPQLGQNPAMQMQQQDAAVAQSIEPATDANPQIMEAQQAAAAAEQQGQQMAAQQEQAAQAAQMEQQQKFQAELMKKEQEKEVLKLQLEKEKAMADLNKAQASSASEAGAGEDSAAVRVNSNRLDRIKKRVSGVGSIKAAGVSPMPAGASPLDPKTGQLPTTTPGTLNPATGQQVPEPRIRLKPHAGNRINAHPGATGMIPNIGVYRASYGKLGDTLFDFFAKKHLYTPDPPSTPRVSRSSQLNAVDKVGLIGQIYSPNRNPAIPGLN